jgi:hypothetical protein
VASGDIAVDNGNVVVKVVWTGSERSVVAGDSLVVTCGDKQLVCLRLNFLRFFQKLLFEMISNAESDRNATHSFFLRWEVSIVKDVFVATIVGVVLIFGVALRRLGGIGHFVRSMSAS